MVEQVSLFDISPEPKEEKPKYAKISRRQPRPRMEPAKMDTSGIIKTSGVAVLCIHRKDGKVTAHCHMPIEFYESHKKYDESVGQTDCEYLTKEEYLERVDYNSMELKPKKVDDADTF